MPLAMHLTPRTALYAGISLLVGLSMAILLSGCDDNVLDATPYGEVTSQNFWRNAADAEAAINAAYSPFLEHDYWGHAEHSFSIPSDDQYRAGDHGEDQAIEELTYGPTNPQLEFSWPHKYESINRANRVLINVPGIEMDPALKNRILGEAHFLRGFNYWRFSVIYGGVPLILEADVEAGEYNTPRASLQETWDQIESDLLRAAELLPLQHDASNVGRPTKGSAWGFLTKLYVYQERWADAIAEGEKVISGPYPLADNFQDNFQEGTENNPEILFGIQSDQGWDEQVHSIYTTPRPWGGWDFHAPTQELVDEFEADDPRRDYSIMMPGDVFDLGGDRGPTEYTADLSPTTGYHYQKYADWRSSGGLNLSLNIPVIRTADVYLLVAEAKIRSGGDGDTEINTVRQRVGLPTLSNAAMQELIHERRVELAGENQRYFDLIRWDKAGIIDITQELGETGDPYNPPVNFERPKHYFFAIPQRQIDLSNGVLQQNPGFPSSTEPCRSCVGL